MKKAQEVMTKKIIWSGPEASLTEIAKLMIDGDCGEIPLLNNNEEKNIVGVITDRDIVCRSLGVGKNPMELKAKDCMTSEVVTGSPDMSLTDCAELMEEHQIRRLPIVDGSNRLVGMIAQADLVQSLEAKEEGIELVRRISKPSGSSSLATH